MGDVSNENPYLFKAAHVGGGLKQYAQYLSKYMGSGGQDAISAARTRAYSDIGSQTGQALDQSREQEAASFGGNQPSGFGVAQRSALLARAPYGAASQGAQQAGMAEEQQLGTSLQNLGLAKGNYFQIIQSLKLQQQAIKNQAALGAAAGGGGGLF